MIDLSLLTALRAFRDSSGDVKSDRLRCAILAASIARGWALSYAASQDVLKEMTQAGLVQFTDSNCRLLPEGEALLMSRAAQEGEPAVSRIIESIVAPLDGKSPDSQYLASLSKQVADLVSKSSLRDLTESDEVVLGAILIDVRSPTTVFRLEFRPGWGSDVSPSTRWRDAHQAAKEWRHLSDSTLEASVEGDAIICLTGRSDCKLRVQGREVSPTSTTPLDNRPAGFLENQVALAIEDRAVALGFRRTGGSGRAFYHPSSENQVLIGDRPVRQYEAFSFRVQSVSIEKCLVWLDEFVHQVVTAHDFIEVNGARELRRAESAGELDLRTTPFGTVGKLEDIDETVDVRTSVAADGLSYYDYWAEKYGIHLEHEVQPVLRLRTGTGTYSYPAEVIRVDLPRQRLPKGHDPKVRSPRTRAQEIRDLGARLFPGGSLSGCGVKMTVLQLIPSLRELRNSFVVSVGAFVAPSPLLLFGDAETDPDPMSIFELAPFAGPKSVEVEHVFWPEAAPREAIKRFLEALSGRFQSRLLGTLRWDRANFVSYPTDANRALIASLVRPLKKVSRPNGARVSLVVVGDGTETYDAFKRYYPDFVRVPIQSVRLATTSRVASGDLSSLNLLALNCYLKVLNPGEPAWGLARSAGQRSERTAYVGIGFSRRLNPKRTGKAAVSLHDSRGFGISWAMCVTPGVERTIDRAWFRMLLDQLTVKWDLSIYDRIVMFRRGRIDPVEIEAMREELASRQDGLGTRTRIVSVGDSRNRFFRRDSQFLLNPEPGTFLLLPDGSALVAASGVESHETGRGTVVPVELSLAIGSDDMKSIAQEYLDLTYLSWSNPQTTWKSPLVLELADRMAALAREGVPDNAIFYLPL